MGITTMLRGERPVVDLNDPRLVTGSPEAQKEAREELRRHTFARKVMGSGRVEIPRAELDFQRFGIIEHVASPHGDYYRATGGDPDYLPNATAYYFAADGQPVLLAPVAESPRSRAERERIEQEREARRAVPPRKPAWMK